MPHRLNFAVLALLAPLPLLISNSAAATPEATPISLARAAVVDRSRDPTSVLFRDLRIAGKCNGVTYVEGWANGKNGFGGYGGFKIFFVRLEHGAAKVMQAYGQVFDTDAAFTIAAACTKD
jgi:hypothetical protein